MHPHLEANCEPGPFQAWLTSVRRTLFAMRELGAVPGDVRYSVVTDETPLERISSAVWWRSSSSQHSRSVPKSRQPDPGPAGLLEEGVPVGVRTLALLLCGGGGSIL